MPARDLLLQFVASLAIAAFSAQALAFAEEERDWGVPAVREIRQPPYHGPTPSQLPGGKVIRTDDLKALIDKGPPLLIDVAAGDAHVTVKGALWLPGAGRGVHFFDPLQADLATRLSALTARDKARPMVFFCVDVQCWLSYNAALRAVALGYTEVYWFRGGVAAWLQAGYPTGKVGEPGK